MWVQEQIESYRRRKTAIAWLDAHCWIGVGRRDSLRPVVTLDQTLQQLARYGIRRAVVAHALARDYDSATGNRLLLDAIADRESLWGAAVLTPDDADEVAFRKSLQTLIAGKVRMMRVFPRSHNWSLSEWCCGPWLSVLEKMRVPLAVWQTETTWDDVAAVCRNHPLLPVIVEGPNRKLLYHNRTYYRLFERFPNFHLEIHNLVGYLGLDDVVRRFGSGRLIFGTYFPQQDPNVPMMLVTHGELSVVDQANIAGGNMMRLMAVVQNDKWQMTSDQ
jgi:predicted TIM-barrel fold metal-dependent hydrolase